MTKKIVVVSHRRSGTHLTIDSIVNNFQAFKNSPAISSATLDHLSSYSQWDVSLLEFKHQIGNGSIVLKSHAHGNIQAFFSGNEDLNNFIQEIFGDAKIIYVHRDGRDVLVSLFHYQRNDNQIAKPLSFSDFLRQQNNFDVQTCSNEMGRVTYWAYHVTSWVKKPNIFVLSFDDLQNQYVATLKKIAAFIEEPLNSNIRDVRRQATNNELITKFKGRLLNKIGNVKYSSVSFRKGVSGDWKGHFSAEDLKFFEDRAGEINRNLGYLDGQL